MKRPAQWFRQAGFAQPDRDAERLGALPWLRLQGVRRHPGRQCEGEIWAIPARTGGPGLLRRMNAWAQGEGQRGSAVFWRKEGDGSRAPARLPRTSARSAPKRSAAARPAEACRLFVAGDPKKFAASLALPARVRRELNLVDRDRFECWIIDFPFYEWDGKRRRSISPTIRSPCRRAGSRR